MRSSTRIVSAAAGCVVAAVVFAGPASADDAAPDADQVAAAVDAATSPAQEAEDVPGKESGSGFAATGDNVTVAIPADGSDPVAATASTAHGALTVTVGTAAPVGTEGELAADGSVVYDGAGATDSTVQPTNDGFRIHTVLQDADAATEFHHEVTLPAGTHLVREADMPGSTAEEGATASSAVFIVDDAGQVLGGFSSPWAKDADGAAVPTRYELRGADLVQVVDHRGGAWAYPIVADPYLGFDMIKSAAWEHHTEGWTLKVTPTGWARWNAGGYLPGVYGWNELYAKYKNRGLNTNLDGMRDQYICHQQVVAVRAPNKPTWNLDEWRPNVSYLQTVNSSCNPGGSKWFD